MLLVVDKLCDVDGGQDAFSSGYNRVIVMRLAGTCLAATNPKRDG